MCGQENLLLNLIVVAVYIAVMVLVLWTRSMERRADRSPS